MRSKSKLLPMLTLGGILLGGGALYAQRLGVSVGVGIGAPPPAVAYVTPNPGPGYYWVQPYWDGHVWVRGYWHAPAFSVGIHAGPGYWGHGRVDHRGHWR
jgi:hypothetical protein